MDLPLDLQNVSNSCAQSESITTVIQATDYVLLIFGLLSIVGHTAALAIALRILAQSHDALLHLIVVTIILNDVILTGLVYPALAFLRLFATMRSRLSCNILQAAVWACITSSCMFTAVLAFDRLLYFRAPGFYKELKKVAVIATCFAVTVLCVGLTASLWVFGVATASESCSIEISADKLLAYDFFVAGFYALPILSALVVAIYLFHAVYKQRNYPKFPALSSRPSPKMSSLTYLVVLTTLTAAVLIPHRILLSWRLHSTMVSDCPSELVLIVTWILQSLTKVFPIVKPLVTFAFLRPYRKALKMVLFRSAQREFRGWFDV